MGPGVLHGGGVGESRRRRTLREGETEGPGGTVSPGGSVPVHHFPSNSVPGRDGGGG